MYLNLRNIVFASGILAAFSSALISCDKLYSNYLQENYQLPETGYLSTEHEINLYADSLHALLPFSKEFKSMIYTLGGNSFQVKKYVHNGKPILYIEYIDRGEHGKIEKNYYIKDNELSLVVENIIKDSDSKPYISRRIYLNEGAVLYAEQSKGLDKADGQNIEFEMVEIKPFDHVSQLVGFEDALNQRNKFDLVFDGIAEYPGAKYLIFSKKEINAYRAPVKVENDDEFVRELSANPLRYRGEKLDINWNLNNNNEAVYAGGKLRTRN